MTPELYTSSSNMGSWIFLGIFFSIIIALIIVATIGSKKDRNEKLVENDKRRKLRTSAGDNRIIIYITIDNLISDLDKMLKDFKPSVGTQSLGDINKDIATIVKKINNSQELKNVYQSSDFKTELKPIIAELVKTKPSSWRKDAGFATTVVEAKVKAIKSNKDNAEIIKLGNNKEWK